MPNRRWSDDDKLLIVEARDIQRYRWETIAEMFPGATAKKCAMAYFGFKSGNPDFDITDELVALA